MVELKSDLYPTTQELLGSGAVGLSDVFWLADIVVRIEWRQAAPATVSGLDFTLCLSRVTSKT